jgi:hypothetical protein
MPEGEPQFTVDQLARGDLGCFALFFGFIAFPAMLAFAAYQLGASVLGVKVLGWVFGTLALLFGILIGKYVAWGAVFAFIFGGLGALAGMCLMDITEPENPGDWAVGATAVGAGLGFILGVILTVSGDVKAARQPLPLGTPDQDSPAASAPTVSAGTCPKCGFEYGWDGVNCSHCGWHA